MGITVHSHPQKLFSDFDNSDVAAAFDSLRLDKTFDTSNPSTNAENSEDLLTSHSSYSSPYLTSSYSDDSAVPNVATSPEDVDIDQVNLGTKLAYNSLRNANSGSDVSPILPWSLSPIDESLATVSDSEASEGNNDFISLIPEMKDFGEGGGAGNGGYGGGSAGLPPVDVEPSFCPSGPTVNPATTPRPAGVLYWEGNGDHEKDSDKPDCPHFPGNLRVLFCCPRHHDSKIPSIAKHPARQANCFLFDKDNSGCWDPRNRFCGFCLTLNEVLMDAANLYFLPRDRQKPVLKHPAAYTLGPPILRSYPGLSEQPGREIWTGDSVLPGRICPASYLKAHGISPNNRSRPPRRGSSAVESNETEEWN